MSRRARMPLTGKGCRGTRVTDETLDLRAVWLELDGRTHAIVGSNRWGVGVVTWRCRRGVGAVSGTESDGGDESAPEPLLDRMWAEASTALAEDRYEQYQFWVQEAILAGEVAKARQAIGTAYRVILSDHLEEQAKAHFGYLWKLGVEQIYREEVYQETVNSAFKAIELFELGEKNYAGDDPERATPIRTTVQRWFFSRLRYEVLNHRTRMQKNRGPLAPGACDEEHSDGQGLPEVPSPDETVGSVLGNLEMDELEAIRRARLALFRSCRSAATRLPLESPDLKVRRAGSDEQWVRRLLVPIVLGFLARLEELVASSEVSNASAIELLSEAFRDACRGYRPELLPNTRHQFFLRNRPEAIWAARAVLEFGVMSPGSQARSPDARARFDAEEMLIAFGLGVVQPLVERLALRITTNEAGYNNHPQVGHDRFVASYGWLEEVLDWVVDETSPAAVLKVVAPTLATLHKPISADRNSTAAEVAQAIAVSDDAKLSADAIVLLALGERLGGLDRSLRTRVERRRS